jgi:hypothetical protein
MNLKGVVLALCYGARGSTWHMALLLQHQLLLDASGQLDGPTTDLCWIVRVAASVAVCQALLTVAQLLRRWGRSTC